MKYRILLLYNIVIFSLYIKHLNIQNICATLAQLFYLQLNYSKSYYQFQVEDKKHHECFLTIEFYQLKNICIVYLTTEKFEETL